MQILEQEDCFDLLDSESSKSILSFLWSGWLTARNIFYEDKVSQMLKFALSQHNQTLQSLFSNDIIVSEVFIFIFYAFTMTNVPWL